MSMGKPKIPTGTVGVACQSTGRFSGFSISVAQMIVPEGSKQVWAVGADIIENCNRMVQEMEGDWLWMMGDDHRWAPELLPKMLDRMYEEDMDILSPVCLKRGDPWEPVIYVRTDDDFGYYPIDLEKTMKEVGEVVEVLATGSAGMLIRKRVLDAMEYPWFASGKLERGGIAEDLYFCLKARELGFRIHVDLTLTLGHMNVFTVWPAVENGEEGIVIEFSEGSNLFLSRASLDASAASGNPHSPPPEAADLKNDDGGVRAPSGGVFDLEQVTP